MIITGTLGLYGLTKDYKDRNTGHLTPAGRRARVLLWTAFAVALTSKSVEFWRDQQREQSAAERAAAEAAKANAIVSELARIVTAVREVRLSFRLSLSDSTPTIKSYLESLTSELRHRYENAEYLDGVSFSEKEIGSWRADTSWKENTHKVIGPGLELLLFPKDSVPRCPTAILEHPTTRITVHEGTELQVDQFFEYAIEGRSDEANISDSRGVVLSVVEFRRSAIVAFTPFHPAVSKVSETSDSSLFDESNENDIVYPQLRRKEELLNARRVEGLTLYFDQQRQLDFAVHMRAVDPCTGTPYDILRAGHLR